MRMKKTIIFGCFGTILSGIIYYKAGLVFIICSERLVVAKIGPSENVWSLN
jgi:hypothetical protein